jgi:hypothetical protein
MFATHASNRASRRLIPFNSRFWRTSMTSEQSPEGAPKKTFPWIDSIADRLASTGLSWAKQSLSMGKRVLETSAKTLSQTAGSLDELGKKLDRPKDESNGH